MPRYNTKFELNIDDMDQIEQALRAQKKDLSLQRLDLQSANGEAGPDLAALAAIDARLAEIHDLLGRLHNQKIFYRPATVKNAPYISG